MMKKTILVILLLLSALLPTYAHPGKTDANGGHYVSGTGQYHYHHGYSAHYHTNGECPYDFVDKIYHSSRESSSALENTGKSYYTISESKPRVYLPPPDSESDFIEKKTFIDFIFDNLDWLSFSLIVLCNIIIFLYKRIVNLYYNCKDKREENKRINQSQSKHKPQPLPKYISPICRVHYNVIPKGYSLSGEWYPIQINVHPLESKYTVHITNDGKCYHRKDCVKIKRYEIKYINIYKAENNGRNPCSCCDPRKPKDLWLDTLRELIKEDCELYERIRKDPIGTQELQNSLLALTDEERAKFEIIIKNNRIRDEIIEIFTAINWTNWTDISDYNVDYNIRYDRAQKEPIELISYDEEMGEAIIKGTSGKNYLVTKTDCSCLDFGNKERHNGPCKHMYYLAMELYKRKLTKGSE